MNAGFEIGTSFMARFVDMDDQVFYLFKGSAYNRWLIYHKTCALRRKNSLGAAPSKKDLKCD